jgi:hypothetical protein
MPLDPDPGAEVDRLMISVIHLPTPKGYVRTQSGIKREDGLRQRQNKVLSGRQRRKERQGRRKV